MFTLLLLLSIISGIIIGFKLCHVISLFALSCYFASTGRTSRASKDLARVTLSGKYIKKFGKFINK
jgi:hypothetical protein